MTKEQFEASGFRAETCGGNTQAWRKDRPVSGYVLLCHGEGELRGDPSSRDWTACHYDDTVSSEALDGVYNVFLETALDFVAKVLPQ